MLSTLKSLGILLIHLSLDLYIQLSLNLLRAKMNNFLLTTLYLVLNKDSSRQSISLTVHIIIKNGTLPFEFLLIYP